MGFISQQFIDDLLNRVDIVEVIDSRVPLTKKGREFVACCPFHDEKTPSFTVSPLKQFYHCFGCGEHGSAISFLMNHENLSYPEAIERLAADAGMPVQYESGTDVKKDHSAQERQFKLLKKAAFWFQARLAGAPPQILQYIKQRGINNAAQEKFAVGFAPDSWDGLLKSSGGSTDELVQVGLLRKNDQGRVYDYFRGRLIFPIHDYMGRVIGFGGRIINNGEPKYLNSPESDLFHKSHELYGLYQARHSLKQHDNIIVVEGYMDVLMLVQYGVENTVATLGTATTIDHIRRLFKIVKKITFCFDGDKAGFKAAIKAMQTALPLLSDNRAIGFVFLPKGEDPDSYIKQYGKQKFIDKVDRAISLDRFIFGWLEKRTPIDSLEGKSSLINNAKVLIKQLPPGAYAEMLIQKLAHKVNMSADKLSRYIYQADNKKRIRPVQNNLNYNLLHRAIALLLAKPALANTVDETEIANIPELRFLSKIILTIKKNPDISYAALHEKLAQTEHIFDKVYRLELILPQEEDMEFEFKETIKRLKLQIKQNSLSKQISHATSATEINELIKQKQRT